MVWQDLEPYDDPAVQFDAEIFKAYQRSIAIRNTLEPLQLGLYRTLETDDDRGLLVFARELDDQRVTVVVNRSPRTAEVTVHVGDATRVVNLNDSRVAEVVPPVEDSADGRPTLRLREGLEGMPTRDERVTLRVEPWGTAILTDPAVLAEPE